MENWLAIGNSINRFHMDSIINLLFVGTPDFCHSQQYPLANNRSYDIESTQFNHPIQALNHLRQCEPQQFPTAILINIDLPLLNGFEFAEIYLFEFYLKHPNTTLKILCNHPEHAQQDEMADNPAINEFLPKSLAPQNIINKMASPNTQAALC